MREFDDADNLTPQRILEAREAVDQIREQGYGQLLEAAAQPAALTQAGNIKISAAARMMNVSPRQVSNQVAILRRAF